MTVTLLRAFDGNQAGMAYTGSAEVEAELIRTGNATAGTQNASAAPEPEPPAPEPTPEPRKAGRQKDAAQ